MAKIGSSISTCFHCKGEYDGTGITVGQDIQCPHCGGAIQHSIPFGDYTLLKPVGEGGVCSVYLAYDNKRKRKVALKLLSKAFAKDMNSILRFFEEAETTGIFKHPNIIQMYEFGEYFGKVYLTMEYLPGGSFEGRMIHSGRQPEIDCLSVGIGAANGLAYAAERGVIHRDVKPGNILFKADGEATVADFGLCVRTNAPNPNTREIFGTVYYVPPERLKAETEDFRSDMYGLAASLYHAMTGQPAFDLDNLDDQEMKNLFTIPVRIRSVRPDITDKTAYAIDRAMAIEPRDRFQSYNEFIQLLKESKKAIMGKDRSKSSLLTSISNLFSR